jgi:RNA polymerase sigma-70 factor (ECF subfamily)
VAYKITSHLDQSDTSLISGLYPQLRSFASVVAPPHEDPNDLVQEAFLRTLRRGPLCDLEYPKAYLRTTIYHLAVSSRRRWASQQRDLIQIVTPVEAPEDPWQVSELLRLAPKARAVLYLHVVEGVPYDEIGDLLGCTAVSARKTASRAKRRLRRLLAAEVDDATT